MKVVCSYDTGLVTSFQTGPLVVADVLYGTTEMDTFAIDAASCKQRWRVHEDVPPSYLEVNRGVAHLDGRLFRGLQDGCVVAYDADTGRRLWEQRIADPKLGESVPAAPIAWEGLVFVGNAGGDNSGVKGRMYTLDAATGKIAWEFHLVPREHPKQEPAKVTVSGPAAEQAASWGNAADVPIAGGCTWTSYTLDPASGLLVAEDFHDWDVSAAPVVTTTKSGKLRLLAAPKDGHLYGYDLGSGQRLYRTPVTTIENVTAPLTSEGTRFCPGTQGGSEWNGPAYDPTNNLAYTGTVDWCTTVVAAPAAKVKNARSASRGRALATRTSSGSSTRRSVGEAG